MVRVFLGIFTLCILYEHEAHAIDPAMAVAIVGAASAGFALLTFLGSFIFAYFKRRKGDKKNSGNSASTDTQNKSNSHEQTPAGQENQKENENNKEKEEGQAERRNGEEGRKNAGKAEGQQGKTGINDSYNGQSKPPAENRGGAAQDQGRIDPSSIEKELYNMKNQQIYSQVHSNQNHSKNERTQ